MATVYSNPVQIGSYNLIRIRCDYSGTSAWLYVEFSRTSSYTGRWYDYNASLAFNGVEIGAPYDYSGTVGEDWVQIADAGSYPISTSGGTYSWSFNNPGGSSVLGCSGSITIPAQGTVPSGGYVNNLTSTFNRTTNQFDITGTAGVTHSGGLDFIYFLCLIAEVPFVSGISRLQVNLENGGSFLINNDSTKFGEGIIIVPNHLYYFGLYAENSVGQYRYQGPSIITQAPEVVNQSVTDIEATSATINWTAPADGGYYPKTYYYSLDEGATWVECGTVTSQMATNKTYTITNLEPNVSYVIQFKVVTTAGTTLCDSFTIFQTPGRFYGSVNGQTKKIKKLYGSVNGQTKLIKHLYGSVNGVTKKIF